MTITCPVFRGHQELPKGEFSAWEVKRLCYQNCSVLVTCTSHLKTRVSLGFFFCLDGWFSWFKISGQNNQIVGALIAFGKKKLFQNLPYSFNPHLSKRALPLLDTPCVSAWYVRNDSNVCRNNTTAVLLMNAFGVSRYYGHNLWALWAQSHIRNVCSVDCQILW